MNNPDPKERLTITIGGEILKKTKEEAKKKGMPLSRVIESFLKFFVNPTVYCFKCGEKFGSDGAELCPKCGWMKCPYCGVCRCKLSDEVATAVFHMRKVYEDLLGGRIK
jgi:hypothetical protein